MVTALVAIFLLLQTDFDPIAWLLSQLGMRSRNLARIGGSITAKPNHVGLSTSTINYSLLDGLDEGREAKGKDRSVMAHIHELLSVMCSPYFVCTDRVLRPALWVVREEKLGEVWQGIAGKWLQLH
jgi:hypothetical protein